MDLKGPWAGRWTPAATLTVGGVYPKPSEGLPKAPASGGESGPAGTQWAGKRQSKCTHAAASVLELGQEAAQLAGGGGRLR